ncbi:MAG: hypothetical protein ACE5DQ_01830, partial [Candidatus Paceibacterota bacterium]
MGKSKRIFAKPRIGTYCSNFFAFITALVFAFLVGQPDGKTTEQLRQNISRKQEQASGNQTSATRTPPSLVDRVLISIGLKKSPPGNSSKQTDTATETSQQEIAQKQLEQILEDAPDLPEVKVGSYNLKTSLPAVPGVIKIYEVKTDYTQTEIKDFASRLGMSSYDVINQGEKLVQIYDLQAGSYLAFNKTDGTFLFMSDQGYSLGEKTDSTVQTARNILSELDITNPCIKSYSTFKRASQEGSTFVELHCDGSIFGAPILSSVGVLNLPTSRKLVQVKVGEVDENAPADLDIIQASDKSRQKRPTEFNTIMVEVDDNTKAIKAVSSNIPLMAQEIVLTRDKLIPPNQIISKLTRAETDFSIAAPVGQGLLDLSTVYAGGAAVAESADVEDLIFAYDMAPGFTGKYICPKYFSRAFGYTVTGYESEFMQTVPAVNDPRCRESAVLGTNSLAQTSSQTDPTPFQPDPTVVNQNSATSLQYSTIRFTGQAAPPPHESACPVDQFTNAYAIPNRPGLYMAWIDKNRAPEPTTNPKINHRLRRKLRPTRGKKKKIEHAREWWVISVSETASITPSSTNLKTGKYDEYWRLRAQLYLKCTAGLRSSCPLPPGLSNKIVSCQYLTTGSPYIHLYPEKATDISVSLGAGARITYTNPAFTYGRTWSATALPSGELQTGSLTKNSLYWEFDRPQMLAKILPEHDSSTGYIVQKGNLESFVKQTLVPSLGLNKIESKHLLSEVIREARNLDGFIKISFLERSILDKHFSMDISPSPERVYRYILLLEPSAGDEKLASPTLTSVDREGFV